MKKRTQNKRNKEIVIPILNNEYKVIVCWGDAKRIRQVLYNWHYPVEEIDFTTALEGMRGRAFSHKYCHPVIALYTKPKTPEQIGTLAHEAVHAVECIFQAVSEPSRDELFAHSVGAIVRETLKSL